MSGPVLGLSGRHSAREEALALLYEVTMTGADIDAAVGARPVALQKYATGLVKGIAAHVGDLDARIGRCLTGWRIERMPALDRGIARIAAFELVHRGDVPTGVVLSEAVALADQYCGEHSRRFLNGVLRSVAEDARPAEPG